MWRTLDELLSGLALHVYQMLVLPSVVGVVQCVVQVLLMGLLTLEISLILRMWSISRKAFCEAVLDQTQHIHM